MSIENIPTYFSPEIKLRVHCPGLNGAHQNLSIKFIPTYISPELKLGYSIALTQRIHILATFLAWAALSHGPVTIAIFRTDASRELLILQHILPPSKLIFYIYNFTFNMLWCGKSFVGAEVRESLVYIRTPPTWRYNK